MARRFQFPFFSVGENFCHSGTLNGKYSEPDELSFFFSLCMMLRTGT